MNFNDFFRNTSAVNIGTEWRIDDLSLRAGYRYEQSPLKSAISSDNLQGFAVGLGYKFGNVKVDLSYDYSDKTGIYDFYPDFNDVDPANIEYKNSNVTATVAVDL